MPPIPILFIDKNTLKYTQKHFQRRDSSWITGKQKRVRNQVPFDRSSIKRSSDCQDILKKSFTSKEGLHRTAFSRVRYKRYSQWDSRHLPVNLLSCDYPSLSATEAQMQWSTTAASQSTKTSVGARKKMDGKERSLITPLTRSQRQVQLLNAWVAGKPWAGLISPVYLWTTGPHPNQGP